MKAPAAGGSMDTSKLVVGQYVCMVSGVYEKHAKVVEVTPAGAIVQLAFFEGPIRPEGPELIRFDKDGKACDSSDIYKGNLWGGSDPRIPGTHECGPWELSPSLTEGEEAKEPLQTD
jgi:hypothetical protein